MKLVYSTKLSVFSKEDDDEEIIIKTLKSLLPFDIEKEKLQFDVTKATGLEDKIIKIIEINLEKQKHVKLFLEKLNACFNREQKDLLIKQVASRLDIENNFFIRLDKDKLIEGEYWVTDSGNCFHIKLTIAAFPKTRENALKIVENLFR